MATRRDLDSADPAPVKPPLGAELWPPRPLEELGTEPIPPPAERLDELFSRDADLAGEAGDEQFLAWVQAARKAET